MSESFTSHSVAQSSLSSGSESELPKAGTMYPPAIFGDGTSEVLGTWQQFANMRIVF